MPSGLDARLCHTEEIIFTRARRMGAISLEGRKEDMPPPTTHNKMSYLGEELVGFFFLPLASGVFRNQTGI